MILLQNEILRRSYLVFYSPSDFGYPGSDFNTRGCKRLENRPRMLPGFLR